MILITGAAGYIGSHCAINFLNSEDEIVIFDNLENGHIQTINMLKEIGKVHFIQGDLKNSEDIENVFKSYEIDTVIHLAGYIEVSESVKNPAKYYENNVAGTINLLNAMIKNNVKNIIFSSSCAVYGEPKYIPIDENHPTNPINPYGRTKLIIEQILRDYDKAYGVKSIVLRYFNAAGADKLTRTGEWHEPETHLIPNIIKAFIEKNKKLNIFGTKYETKDGTCIRDYVNVEDIAQAHKLAYIYLKENQKSDCFNIGTEKGNSVKEVYLEVQKVTQETIIPILQPPRNGDSAILLANSQKAKNILKWKPERNLHDSIITAYKWELLKQNKGNI